MLRQAPPVIDEQHSRVVAYVGAHAERAKLGFLTLCGLTDGDVRYVTSFVKRVEVNVQVTRGSPTCRISCKACTSGAVQQRSAPLSACPGACMAG